MHKIIGKWGKYQISDSPHKLLSRTIADGCSGTIWDGIQTWLRRVFATFHTTSGKNTRICIYIYIHSTHILLKASVGVHMTIRFTRCTARGNSEKLTELLPKVRPWSQGNHNLRADPSQAASNMLFRMLTDHGVIFLGSMDVNLGNFLGGHHHLGTSGSGGTMQGLTFCIYGNAWATHEIYVKYIYIYSIGSTRR